ncbi:MAG TPA: alpha/beta fold hydrolase [Chitinophagaceae bacterium]|nr:alpha/beta fold hydrolase [Chitinophagaceae bacterium]
MKKILLVLTTALMVFTSKSQDLSGDWYGALKIGANTLRLSLNFSKNDTGYSGKMISIDQGNSVLPMAWVKLDQNSVSFKTTVANVEYAGTVNEKNIEGTFKQNGQAFPLNFGREKIEKTVLKRPQEPKPPFPYISEEINFLNARDSIMLAGTLTIPASGTNFPVVVLISGSGPQNRNEELMGHKPFLVLADHLTKNGIAVLRYDDRGVAASKGNFQKATSADFATDVSAAVQYLKTRKEIDGKKIGLIGHSEGGMIAPMVAAQSKDISYIILLAGPGVPGKDIIILQQELISRAGGVSDTDIATNTVFMKNLTSTLASGKDEKTSTAELNDFLKTSYQKLPDSIKKQTGTESAFIAQFSSMNTAWMKYFLTYDPAIALQQLKIPVLALNGSKDLQVSPAQNLPAIEKALKKAGNKNYTVKELPNLNHLFQECKTGAPGEYSEIEQTMSPVLLNEVANWIKKQAGQ